MWWLNKQLRFINFAFGKRMPWSILQMPAFLFLSWFFQPGPHFHHIVLILFLGISYCLPLGGMIFQALLGEVTSNVYPEELIQRALHKTPLDHRKHAFRQWLWIQRYQLLKFIHSNIWFKMQIKVEGFDIKYVIVTKYILRHLDYIPMFSTYFKLKI